MAGLTSIRWRNLFLFATATAVYASQGDIDVSFRICVQQCSSEMCSSAQKSKFGDGFPYWNCNDDCSYDCMQSITSERSLQGYGPLKYYGHWPFLRTFGLEEPASVVFSLFNAVPYIISLFGSYKKKNCDSKDTFMDRWLTLYYIISINTWLASAFFHSRKTENASFYDYISALLFLGYSLWLATRRILGAQANSKIVLISFVFSLTMYVSQVVRMHFGYVTFDDHMNLSITIAILNVVTWLSWLLISAPVSSKGAKEKHSYRYLCLICQIWFSLAALLELFDFPAIWGIFDAHSLWHAATIPLGFVWAYFWRTDREMFLNGSKKDC